MSGKGAPSSAASLVAVTKPSSLTCRGGVTLWGCFGSCEMLQTTVPQVCVWCCAQGSLLRGRVHKPLSVDAETCCAEEAPDSGETQLFHNWT